MRRGQRRPAEIGEEGGDGAFAELAALIGEQHLVGLGDEVLGTGVRVGLPPAGLMTQQRVGRVEPGARESQFPYPVRGQRLVGLRRGRHVAVARQDKAGAQGNAGPADGIRQRPGDPPWVAGEAEFRRRGVEPRQMPLEADEARAGFPAQGFDQVEAGLAAVGAVPVA